ncbi:MAG: GNAT family N-acetyltransferase, partial [Aggregatilineales bacterium]
LKTERCLLRDITLADTDAFYNLLTDERVYLYLGSPPLTSRQTAADRIEATHDAFNDGDSIRWIVTLSPDDTMIGAVNIWNIRAEHHRAELGYWLSPDYWGKGIVPEACAAVLEYAFNTMKFHSIDANIEPVNKSSQRVLEKLGFVQEAYFREDFYDPVKEQFTDSAIFSLLAKNWQKSS